MKWRPIVVTLLATAWVLATGLVLMFASDILLARAWRCNVFLLGCMALGLATLRSRGRNARAEWWFGAGLAAVGLCILFANLVWPLQNELSGAFFSGRGVVNYVFMPWLHAAFFLAGMLTFTRKKKTTDVDAF